MLRLMKLLAVLRAAMGMFDLFPRLGGYKRHSEIMEKKYLDAATDILRDQSRAEIRQLQAENKRLRKLLQPFVDFLDEMEGYGSGVERRVDYEELCEIREALKDNKDA